MKKDIFIDMDELKAVLEGTQYHELKDKFDELGIPNAWKAGTGKIDLVTNAIEMYKGKFIDKTIVEEAAPRVEPVRAEKKATPKKAEAKPTEAAKPKEVKETPKVEAKKEAAKPKPTPKPKEEVKPKETETPKPKEPIKTETVAPKEDEEKAPLTLEVIEKNLTSINLNLLSAKGARRTALIKKRNELQEMRDEYYG